VTAQFWCRRTVALLLCAFLTGVLSGSYALPESVVVEHRGDVNLASFSCTQLPHGEIIQGVCYDPAESYLIVRLSITWYQFCAVDAATVKDLLSASSVDTFFDKSIRGHGKERSPFDCRDHPPPADSSEVAHFVHHACKLPGERLTSCA
jgi:hypothetical protein